MSNPDYTLSNLLLSIFTIKNNVVEKRIIYNKASLGGLHNNWIKLIFFLLPFIMYGAIFNPKVFAYLGIAQAIVFYIIMLVVSMQIIVGVAYFNNRKVVKKTTPSWENYFPSVDFKMILSSGVTPYVDFKKHYEQALEDGLDEEALHKRLQINFKQMEEENLILYEAMQREK